MVRKPGGTTKETTGTKDTRTPKDAPYGRARRPVTVGLGVSLLLLSSVLFGLVPGRIAEKDAFLSAPACPAGTRPGGSCRAAVEATVREKVEVHEKRTPDYDLVVAERGSGTVRRLRMDGHTPVYEAVRAGDAVMLTSWRGGIRNVRFGDAVQDTRLSPVDDWRLPLGVGLAVLPLGLLVLWSAWALPRHRGAGRRTWPWWPAGIWVAGAVLSLVGVLAGLSGDDVPRALLIQAVGAVPAAGVGGLFVWGLRRRMRRAADVRDVVPVRPVRRQCVRASVRGEVPYSVSGFGYLVVGDGPPAATPDPAGRVALRPFPPSLVVSGVRSFLPDDPAGWPGAYKYDGVVIECRDGDEPESEPVAVATGRRDAPLVLGALTAAPATA
ncbi:hypothetical protein QFZ63_006938 [Streptomyces sp. B3I7]|nr:hypothetical protein [Streptomyces sp. B3I7]